MNPTNQILITLDSCRWDTFVAADAQFLKSGRVEKCFTHATFTMAAHQAFFAGKLPHSFSGKKHFDTAAAGKRKKRIQRQIWRLANPESHRESAVQLEGQNIKDGFRQKGYTTIGTGAMNWFDPRKPAPAQLISDFDHYRFFPNQASGDGRNLEQQVEWALDLVTKSNQPYFLFINIGETHHRYAAKGHDLTCDWGDAAGCAAAQRASLEYIDSVLQAFFAELEDYFAVICGDHGDCWGEDGLWGHGFYHPCVMQVPMVVMDDREMSRMKRLSNLWILRRSA